MKKLFIFDVYNFFFRAYYALPNLFAENGKPIGAVHGFLSMILRYLIEKPDYVLLALDSGVATFRNDIYSQYKANRSTVEDNLKQQFDILREAIDAFDIPNFNMIGYEADDIIASAVKKFCNQGIEIFIFSSDKDLLQLHKYCPNTYLRDPIKNIVITDEYIFAKYGVCHTKLLDVFSLAGDASDNIPGVPGIGIKTAVDLIKTYGSLELVLENVLAIKQNKRREMLILHSQDAILSKSLISLYYDIDISLSMNDLEFKEFNFYNISSFLHKYSLKSIFEFIQNKNLVIAVNDVDGINKDVLSTVVLNMSTKDLLKNATYIGYVAIYYHQDNKELFLGYNSEYVYKFDISELLDSDSLISHIFKASYIIKVFDNAKELMKVSTINSAEHLNLMAYSLDTVRKNLTNIINEFCNTQFDVTNMLVIPSLMIKAYNALKILILNSGCSSIYYDIERSLIPIVANMEATGIMMDRDILARIHKETEIEIEKVETQIFEKVGHEFLISSTKQLSDILFNEDKLNIRPKTKKLKSGVYSTDYDSLVYLASQGHTIAILLIEWRSLTKIKTTYTEGLIKFYNHETQRVHTTYNTDGTTTGRLSSNNPNMQNIPIDRKIKMAFVAKKDHIFLSADYSQIEIRLLAYMANSELIKKALRDGLDIHVETAKNVFHLPNSESVTDELRKKAKAINFGIIYGISAYGLSKNLNISISEASQYIASYFECYPDIKNYINNAKLKSQMNGYSETYFGRMCKIDTNNLNNHDRNSIDRFAVNATLQGSAADIIKRAMIVLYKEFGRNVMVLQIHDELIFEFPKNAIKSFIPKVKCIMENISNLELIVDFKIGENLMEMERV